jgi:hypothetical protein
VKTILSLIFFISIHASEALSQSVLNKASYAELGLAGGNLQGTASLAYLHDWKVGQKKKFNIGTGIRLTSYIGRNQYYVTAPAKLTSGKTGVGVIFVENVEANMDTLLIKSAHVTSLNLLIDLNYLISEKLTIGFNIDAIGFSFGKTTNGTYINGFQGSVGSAKPTPFNLLLVSDNDLGSLNSEFYARYFFNNNWGIKAALQFLFTEYKTETPVQQLPESNDRFRKKSLLVSIGITRKL